MLYMYVFGRLSKPPQIINDTREVNGIQQIEQPPSPDRESGSFDSSADGTPRIWHHFSRMWAGVVATRCILTLDRY